MVVEIEIVINEKFKALETQFNYCTSLELSEVYTLCSPNESIQTALFVRTKQMI